MNCPKCRTELRRETVGGVEVDRCPACQGLWFDAGELEKVLQQTRDDTRRRFSRAIEPGKDEAGGECPACGPGSRLIPLRSLANRAVTLDGCKVCYGRWLDGGELAKLGDPSILERLRSTLRQWL